MHHDSRQSRIRQRSTRLTDSVVMEAPGEGEGEGKGDENESIKAIL